MRKVLPAFLVIAILLLGASVLPRIALGPMFDLNLVAVIVFGLAKGELRGAVFGFFVGLVHGILMASFVGFFALLGFVAGYVCGFFQEYDSQRSMAITILIVLGVVFAYQTASYFGQAVLFGQLEFLQRLHMVVLPKTILTTALFVPVYMFVGFIRKRVELA